MQGGARRARAGEARAAACALEALDRWARNGALLGGFDRQGQYHRARAVSGAALAFLAIHDAPDLDPLHRGRVARWFGELGRDLRTHFDRSSEALISDVRNVEAAWAGLAAAAAGLAAGDRGGVDWGTARLRAQLASVDERGALEQEARRGAAALHTHLSALSAIAGLERIAAAQGLALSKTEEAALRRLRDLLRDSLLDPGRMAAVSGVLPRDPHDPGAPPAAAAAGLALLQLTRPDEAVEALLAPHRPLAEPSLGGAVEGWRALTPGW